MKKRILVLYIVLLLVFMNGCSRVKETWTTQEPGLVVLKEFTPAHIEIVTKRVWMGKTAGSTTQRYSVPDEYKVVIQVSDDIIGTFDEKEIYDLVEQDETYMVTVQHSMYSNNYIKSDIIGLA